MKVVAVAAAVVRRDGRVQAAGHPADHAWLGRHRDRKTKARPGFPADGPRLATRTAPAQITVCQPQAA